MTRLELQQKIAHLESEQIRLGVLFVAGKIDRKELEEGLDRAFDGIYDAIDEAEDVSS